VNWYLAAALVLQVALIPCAWVCWRFDSERRVVALGLADTVQVLAPLCLAVGYREPGLASLAGVLAALSGARPEEPRRCGCRGCSSARCCC
jgi:hypothetical protein